MSGGFSSLQTGGGTGAPTDAQYLTAAANGSLSAEVVITGLAALTGVAKGNGTGGFSAATAGTDYTVGSTGLAGGQTIAGGTLTTQDLTLRANATDTTTGSVSITTSTASTTKTTGALKVAGGVGVSGAINANDLTVTNTITGSISGNAATVTTNANLTGAVTSVGNATTMNSALNDLTDVTTTSPATDQVLRYNGAEWINGAASTAAGSAGVSFFPDDTTITASGTESTYAIKTLSKTPITSAEDVDSIACASSTVLYGTYLYNTALNRTTLDAGIWTFEVYAGVDNVGGTTTLKINTNRVRAGTGTVDTTGTGTTRTVTASSGTPFAVAAIDVGGTIDSDSFLQTTTGYFRILSIVGDTVVTIAVPSTYSNQTTVAYSVHKRLFQVSTAELNNVAVTPSWLGLQLNTINSVQPAYTTIAGDKIALAFFGTSDQARTVYFAHNGTTRYSHLVTPLSTVHGNLAGLQGGTGSVPTEEYYHLTSAQHTNLTGGTPSFTSVTATGAAGITLGTDVAGGTPNIAGYIKMFGSGDDAFYNTFTSGDNTANATYTLPVAMPASSGYALVSTDAGVMSWASLAAVNQTFYIGTTQVAINRASAALTLAGITLTTPDIGSATATTVNKITITQPANGATLTIQDGFTLTVAGNASVSGTNTGDSASLPIGGGTMTGDIQLGETAIKLDETLSGDATWSGITTKGLSGVTTLAIGDLIYLNADDSRWELVDANEADGYDKQLGIALTAAADGAALEVLLYGKVRSAVFPAFTVGSALYMSETAGDVTHTAPVTADSCSRIVGFALTAEDLLFNPSNDYIIHI